MRTECTGCGHESRAGATYCARCGMRIMHAIRPVNEPMPVHVEDHGALRQHGETLAAHMRLEIATRLNPLMNHERLKVMVMAIASRGGTGTVGFWSDD